MKLWEQTYGKYETVEAQKKSVKGILLCISGILFAVGWVLFILSNVLYPELLIVWGISWAASILLYGIVGAIDFD